jgi:hypothetical protein
MGSFVSSLLKKDQNYFCPFQENVTSDSNFVTTY